MGLDIDVEINIKKSDASIEDYEDGNCIGRVVYLYPNEYFLAQADGIKEGLYNTKNVFNFRAGSYSGYGEWRRGLAEMIGYEAKEIWENPEPSIPFVELINFADNEGVIGPVTSKKLYEDFKKYLGKAKKLKDDYFMGVYNNFMKAFKIAGKKNGCVQFH